jgi:hypothetical protein
MWMLCEFYAAQLACLGPLFVVWALLSCACYLGGAFTLLYSPKIRFVRSSMHQHLVG